MLAQHLIQPDMRHGLGFVGSVFTGKVFWKGSGEESEDEDGNILPTGAQWKTWDSPEAIPRQFGGYGGCHSADEAWRLYNARDTDGTLQAEASIFRTLRDYRLESVYRNVSVPAAYICRDINRTGLRIDSTRVSAIREDLHKQIVETELRLPEGLKPYDKEQSCTIIAPPETYRSKTLKCRGTKRVGTAHESVSWVVDQPGVTECPTCRRSYEPKLVIRTRIKSTKLVRIVPWNSNAQVIAY